MISGHIGGCGLPITDDDRARRAEVRGLPRPPARDPWRPGKPGPAPPPVISSRMVALYGSLPTWRDTVRRVCAEHGVEPRDVLGKARVARVVAARKAAMVAVAMEWPGLSLASIGTRFGTDHTSVAHHLKAAGCPTASADRLARAHSGDRP